MTAIKHSAAASFHQPLLDPLYPHSPSPQYVVLPPPPSRPRLLRSACRRCIFCFAIFLLLSIAASYLLWPSDPELSIVCLQLHRLQFHTSPKISLDATLALTLKIRNQDLYSFDYDSLLVSIGYRGEQLGYVSSGAGQVRAHHTSYVNATLLLNGADIFFDVVLLLEDLVKGEVGFNMTSEIDGKLAVLRFDLPIKKIILCEVAVNTQNQTVARQSCYTEVSEATEVSRILQFQESGYQ